MKNLLRYIFLVIPILFYSTPIFSNGGPDAFLPGAYGNKSIHKFKPVPTVKLLKENLDVKLKAGFSEVHVEYFFESETNQTVPYLFPVKVCLDDFAYDLSGNTKIKPGYTVNKKIPRSIQMKLNDTSLAVKEVIVQITSMNDSDRKEIEDYCLNSDASIYELQWQTILNFKKGQQKLLVDYRLPNIQQGWSTSKTPFVLGAAYYFKYDFAPASFWGDGTLKELNITLSAKDSFLPVELDDHEQGEETWFWGPRFKGTEPMTARRNEVDLKNLAPLIVNTPSPAGFQYLQLKEKNSVVHPVVPKITSDVSAKQGYPLANLTDGKLNTAFVPEKTPTTITLDFGPQNDDQRISYECCITKGYLKNKSVYEDNSRLEILDESKPLPDATWRETNGVLSDDLFACNVSTDRLELKVGYAGKTSNDLAISELICAKIVMPKGGF